MSIGYLVRRGSHSTPFVFLTDTFTGKVEMGGPYPIDFKHIVDVYIIFLIWDAENG